MTPSDIRTRQDRVKDSWEMRPCFVCKRLGVCPHREYHVELALVDAELRLAQRETTPAKITPIKRRTA